MLEVSRRVVVVVVASLSATLLFVTVVLYFYSTSKDSPHTAMPKDTELYDLLGVKPEATDIE